MAGSADWQAQLNKVRQRLAQMPAVQPAQPAPVQWAPPAGPPVAPTAAPAPTTQPIVGGTVPGLPMARPPGLVVTPEIQALEEAYRQAFERVKPGGGMAQWAAAQQLPTTPWAAPTPAAPAAPEPGRGALARMPWVPDWLRRAGEFAYGILRPSEERVIEAWQAPFEEAAAARAEEPVDWLAISRETAETGEGPRGWEAWEEARRKGFLQAPVLGAAYAGAKALAGVTLAALATPAEVTEQAVGEWVLREPRWREAVPELEQLTPEQLSAVARWWYGYAIPGRQPDKEIAGRGWLAGQEWVPDWLRGAGEWAYGLLGGIEEVHPERLRAAIRMGLQEPERFEEIVASQANIWWQYGAQALMDPLQAIDYAGAVARIRRVSGLDKARAAFAVAATVEDAEPLRKGLEISRQVLEQAADAERAAEVAGAAVRAAEPGGLWRRVARLWEPTRQSRAIQDVADTWRVTGGALAEARSGDEALELLRQWADAPEELTSRLGNVPVSRAGRKAQALLADLVDEIGELPSFQAPPGQFNPAEALLELDDLMLPRAMQAYGVPARGAAYRRFADAWKRVTSEFYLTAIFSPGYVVRNTAGDYATQIWDGLARFDSTADQQAYLGRFGVTTRRLETSGMGAMAGEGVVEGPSPLRRIPLVGEALGAVAERGRQIARRGELFRGRLAVGEEPRYRAALTSALRKVFDQQRLLTQTPALPEDLARLLGPRADELRAAVAQGLNRAEKEAAVRRILQAQDPAHGLEPSVYLPAEFLDELDPELLRTLRGRLDELPMGATREDVARVFGDLDEEVTSWAERIAAEGPAPRPVRRTAAGAEEAELVDAAIVEMEEDARRLGLLTDPQVQAQLEALRNQLEQLRQALQALERRAIERALEAQTTDAIEGLFVILEDLSRLREEARRVITELMKETRTEYLRDPALMGPQVWPEYFERSAERWTASGEARLARAEQGIEELDRFLGGERFEAVWGESARDRARQRLIRLSRPELWTELPPGYEPGLITEDPADLFDQFLQAKRDQTEQARLAAFRAARATVGQAAEKAGDVGDILFDVLRYEDQNGTWAAGRVARERAATFRDVEEIRAAGGRQMKARLKRRWQEWVRRRNAIWNDEHRGTIGAWRQAEVRLQALVDPSAVARIPELDLAALEARFQIAQDALQRAPDDVEALRELEAAREALHKAYARPAEVEPVVARPLERVPLPDGVLPDSELGRFLEGVPDDQYGLAIQHVTHRHAQGVGDEQILEELRDLVALQRAPMPGPGAERTWPGTVEPGREGAEFMAATLEPPPGTVRVIPRTSRAGWGVDFLDDRGRVIMRQLAPDQESAQYLADLVRVGTRPVEAAPWAEVQTWTDVMPEPRGRPWVRVVFRDFDEAEARWEAVARAAGVDPDALEMRALADARVELRAYVGQGEAGPAAQKLRDWVGAEAPRGVAEERAAYTVKLWPRGEHPWIAHALDIFGETWDWQEAGYLLPDGRMLDFSGRSHGAEGVGGSRYLDHREILEAMMRAEEEGHVTGPSPPGGSESMWDFIFDTGAVRMSIFRDYAGVDVGAPLTWAQRKVLSQIARERGLMWSLYVPEHYAPIARGEDAFGVGDLQDLFRAAEELAPAAREAQAAYSTFPTAAEVARMVREADLVPASVVAGIMGDVRPQYLDQIVGFVLRQREKLLSGQMTARDVAKAYLLTVGSQGADHKALAGVMETFVDLGGQPFEIPAAYTSRLRTGEVAIRPEEGMAAWLLSPQGQRALDGIDRGEFVADAWEDARRWRHAFGDDRLGNFKVLDAGNPARKTYAMQDVEHLSLIANLTDPEEMAREVARLRGVDFGKTPFIKHLLGLGEAPTIDAVELNVWLTGKATTRWAEGKGAELARLLKTREGPSYLQRVGVQDALRGRIGERFLELQRMGLGADLDPDIARAILHHWLWDKAKGVETLHEGMYEAMRVADARAGYILDASDAPVNAPRWFYRAEQMINERMPKRAPVAQVRAILTKGGVKKDELEWSGVLEWLDRQEGMLEKEDVLGFLRENQVRVEEVLLGGAREAQPSAADFDWYHHEGYGDVMLDPDTAADEMYVLQHPQLPDALGFEWTIARDLTLDRWGFPEEWSGDWILRREGNFVASSTSVNDLKIKGEDEALSYLLDEWDPGDAKYAEYTLPGGRYYRELLLTLPYERLDMPFEKWLVARGPGFVPEGEMALSSWRKLWRLQRKADADVFRSAHWDEPNVLAHVRFNERVGDDGTLVLFIEEIQSDWHQAGREKGYRPAGVFAEPDWDQWVVERVESPYYRPEWVLKDPDGYRRYAISAEVVPTIDEARQVMIAEYAPFARRQWRDRRPPVAPFAKTWDELVLKRMFRWAAEQGYDRVAWTTGAQQAERYALANYVDELAWYEETTGEWMLEGYRDEQKVVSHVVPPDELPEYVGKDVARKLIESQAVDPEGIGQALGEDLQVGGLGMTTFYDRILPYSARKVVKGYGGEVGRSRVSTGNLGPWEPDGAGGLVRAGPGVDYQEVWSVDVTPDLRREVMARGFPLFEERWGYSVDELHRAWQEPAAVGEDVRAAIEAAPEATDYASPEAAQAALAKYESGPGQQVALDGTAEPARGQTKLYQRDLVQRGFIDFRGQSVSPDPMDAARDVAELFRIYRDPEMETLRAIYVRDGKIVAHEAFTSGLIDMVAIGSPRDWARWIERLRQRVGRLGADDVYLLHNHPSGNPFPTVPADLHFTRDVAERVPELRAHLVIDGETFHVIPVERARAVVVGAEAAPYVPAGAVAEEYVYIGSTYDVPHRFREPQMFLWEAPSGDVERLARLREFGQLKSPRDVVEMVAGEKLHELMVVWVDIRNQVVGFETMPNDWTLDPGRAWRFLNQRQREVPAASGFVVASGRENLNDVRNLLMWRPDVEYKAVILDGIVLDEGSWQGYWSIGQENRQIGGVRPIYAVGVPAEAEELAMARRLWEEREAFQAPMFPAGEELPLFTGTPMRGEPSPFAPPEELAQPGLPGMEPTFEELAEAERARRAARAQGRTRWAPPEQARLFERRGVWEEPTAFEPRRMTPEELEAAEAEVLRRQAQMEAEEADWLAEMEAAVGPPPAHPLSLDDLLAEWNVDPATAGQQEWDRVLDALQKEMTRRMERSSPEYLDGLVDRIVRGGETRWVEVGGQAVESRRRLARSLETPIRRALMGFDPDVPVTAAQAREFYRRQADLAEWYYNLLEALGEIRAGGVVPELSPPAWLVDEPLYELVTAERAEQAAWRARHGAGVETTQLPGEVAPRPRRTRRPAAEPAPAAEPPPAAPPAEPPAAVPAAEAAAPAPRSRTRPRGPDVQAALAELEATKREIEEARALGRNDLIKAAERRVARAEQKVIQAMARADNVPDDLRAVVADALAGVAGAGEPPMGAEMAAYRADRQREALGAMFDGMMGDWGNWQPVADQAAVERSAMDWLNSDVMPAWNEHRTVGVAAAEQLAHNAVLDYTQRRGFDELLSLLVPYHYWFTRSAYNWGKRLAKRPSFVADYMRYRKAMERVNQDRQMRQRFEGRWKVPAPFLPEWTGQALYVNPVRLMLPFSFLADTNWDDPSEARNALGTAYRGLTSLGFRPYPWIEAAGRELGGEPGGAGGLGFLLPQTRGIRAVTGMMEGGGLEPQMGAEPSRWVPPGGVNIEARLREAVGLPRGELWDPYRLSRALADLAGETPGDLALATLAMQAQELVERAAARGHEWATMLDPASSEVQSVAAEMGWAPETAEQVVEVLRLAMRREGIERGIPSLTGWLGLSGTIEPTGERRQIELQRQYQQAVYPAAPEGSRQAYYDIKEQYPAVWARQQTGRFYPEQLEETESTYLGPGYTANLVQRLAQRATVNQQYDQMVDQLIRERPWDEDARRALESERFEALAAIDERYPVPERDLPVVKWGQSPEERSRALLDEALEELRVGEPEPEQYSTDEGEVDWVAYYDARDVWRGSLPESHPALEAARAFGASQARTLVEALDEAARRWDSPLEAAAKTWEAEVWDTAWDQWRAAKAAGDRRAYANTVGRVPAMRATELIPRIQARYPGRWSDAELGQALEGVEFPPASEVQALRKGEEPRATARATGAAGAPAAAGEPTVATAREQGVWPGWADPWWVRAFGGDRLQGGFGGARGRAPGGSWRWRPATPIYGGPQFRR